MNTINLEKILNDAAIKNGYESFMEAARIGNIHYVPLIAKEAMQEYARQCCDEQIQACAEKATANFNAEVDKESILSTPNVVTTNL